MTVAVTYDELSTFLVFASGDVTSADMRFVLRQIRTHGAFEAGAQILLDARTMVGAPPTDELREVALEMRQLSRAGLRAMAIVAESEHAEDVARTFPSLADVRAVNVAVFPTVDEARRWLGEQSRP